MSLQHLRQASWLRTVLRVLVLCFALGTLANAGHTHDVGSSSHAHFNCDYCTSYAGLIDAPAQAAATIHWPVATGLTAAPVGRIVIARPVGVAQARAPPASC